MVVLPTKEAGRPLRSRIPALARHTQSLCVSPTARERRWGWERWRPAHHFERYVTTTFRAGGNCCDTSLESGVNQHTATTPLQHRPARANVPRCSFCSSLSLQMPSWRRPDSIKNSAASTLFDDERTHGSRQVDAPRESRRVLEGA